MQDVATVDDSTPTVQSTDWDAVGALASVRTLLTSIDLPFMAESR
jgi:hypothetical protein